MGDRSWEYYETCRCRSLSLSTVTVVSITTRIKFSLTSPFTQHGPLKGVDDNTHHRQRNGRCYYCAATSVLTFVGNVQLYFWCCRCSYYSYYYNGSGSRFLDCSVCALETLQEELSDHNTTFSILVFYIRDRISQHHRTNIITPIVTATT